MESLRDKVIRWIARLLIKYPKPGVEAETAFYLGELARGR